MSNHPEGEVLPQLPGNPLYADDYEEATMGAMDKLKDKAEAAKGDAKKKLGDATDNEQWQAEGKGEQMKGDLKQAGEKVKDAF